MATAFDFLYTVKDSDGPLEYPGGSCNIHQPGDVIRVKHSDKACFFENVLPENDKACCFPEYCVGSDGYPTGGYRVPVLVPAGATDEIHIVPSIEGCKPPGMVCFDYCASCIYVGYDAAPLVDPADPDAQAGGGADPNPTCRDLVEKGVCVETLHFNNPTDADVTVMLSYYC